MAAYLRNAPPAYECDRGALPSLSHFRPAAPSPIPETRRVCPRSRHAQPAAVYPQSIKDDRQHEYQQRQQLPVAGHPPTHPPRDRAILPDLPYMVHARAPLSPIPRCCIRSHRTYRAIGQDFSSAFFGCIEKERFKEFRRSEDERRATTRTKDLRSRAVMNRWVDRVVFFFFLMDFREARFRWISSVEQRPFRLIYYTG